MTNNEKIQRATQPIAEANVLLNEVKANSSNEEDIIANYKNDYNKGRQYYLNSQSEVDFISVGDSFEKERLFLSPYQHYLTEELAEQAKKLKDFNDKLLAFKYCYDLDYKPDWSDDTTKYYVYYDVDDNKYATDGVHFMNISSVYFSTKEIAQKCAEWLNSLSE
jgi:hypothetical protein